MDYLITLSVGLIGLILGGATQFYFNQRSESFRHRADMRSTAYVDFVKAVAGRVEAQQRADSAAEAEFIRQLIDSKMRIAMVGSQDVICNLALFLSKGGTTATSDERDSLRAMIESMRHDMMGRQGDVGTSDINILIYGTR